MSLENRHIIQQLAPFEKIPQKRLHSAPIAKSYLESKTYPILSNQPNSDTDAEREEKLALDKIIIYWMVDGANQMREQKPPYGLVFSENGFEGDFSSENMKLVEDANLLGDPFSTFSFAIRHTFANALEQKRRQIFAMPQGHETAIYRKYLEYAHRNGIKLDDPHGIKFLVSTSNTALRIMGDILSHAQDIDSTSLGRKITIYESASAARNSTPLLTKLASYQQGVFDIIHNSMASHGIWESLTIVEYAGKMYYQIKDPVLKSALDQLSRPEIREKLEKKSRGGCPARNGAIEILWSWYIDYSVKALRTSL